MQRHLVRRCHILCDSSRDDDTELVCLGESAALASSHRKAPRITESPKVDGTVFYMFNNCEPDREGYDTLDSIYLPLHAPLAGPNYFSLDPDALYEIHVSNGSYAEETHLSSIADPRPTVAGMLKYDLFSHLLI